MVLRQVIQSSDLYDPATGAPWAGMMTDMTARSRLFLVAVGATCIASACSGRTHPAVTQPVTALSATPQSTRPFAPLTPSIPGLFVSESNACGDPYEVTATTLKGTIPLADCPGWIGLHPTPSLTVTVGDEVTIAGLRDEVTLTEEPA